MKKKIQSGLLLAILAYTGVAMAEKVDYVNIRQGGIHPNDGSVVIKPINGNYGQATRSTVSYHVEMKAGCKRQNVLKSAFISFGTENVSKDILEASSNYRVTVQTNMRKTLSWTGKTMVVPLTKIGMNPAAICQSLLNQKMSQGVSRQQFLNQDHPISKPVSITAVATCGRSGKNDNQYGSSKMTTQLRILCKGGSVAGIGGVQAPTSKPKPTTGSFQAPAKVTLVRFRASPAEVNATCPAKVRFTGAIGLSGPGTVQYRVSFPGTNKPYVRTLKFSKAGTLPLNNIEWVANQSMPTATAMLHVLSPGEKKLWTKFKVTCIAAGGPGAITK